MQGVFLRPLFKRAAQQDKLMAEWRWQILFYFFVCCACVCVCVFRNTKCEMLELGENLSNLRTHCRQLVPLSDADIVLFRFRRVSSAHSRESETSVTAHTGRVEEEIRRRAICTLCAQFLNLLASPRAKQQYRNKCNVLPHFWQTMIYLKKS